MKNLKSAKNYVFRHVFFYPKMTKKRLKISKIMLYNMYFENY